MNFQKNMRILQYLGQSNDPMKLKDELIKKLEEMKKNGIDEKIFNRIKKKIYGGYVGEFNDVSNIARMFMGDYFKGINSFEYIEEYNQVTKEYAENILKKNFDEEKMIISIVKGKNDPVEK